jgi:DNA helicase-2/ATP-dependent DNA helicase PcrA
MDTLLNLRAHGSIGDVLDDLETAMRIPFPESLRQIGKDLAQIGAAPVEDEPSACTRLRNMRPVSYKQVISLVQFIERHTPFQTKHGVKGAQFENVLAVFDRGWNHYNFEQFLAWNSHPPADKIDLYERNRNLFYVVCSHPQHRLALLFAQYLNADALMTLRAWFGGNAMHALSPNG